MHGNSQRGELCLEWQDSLSTKYQRIRSNPGSSSVSGPISPKRLAQLLVLIMLVLDGGPFEYPNERLVESLGLPIALRVVWGGEHMSDAVLAT